MPLSTPTPPRLRLARGSAPQKPQLLIVDDDAEPQAQAHAHWFAAHDGGGFPGRPMDGLSVGHDDWFWSDSQEAVPPGGARIGARAPASTHDRPAYSPAESWGRAPSGAAGGRSAQIAAVRHFSERPGTSNLGRAGRASSEIAGYELDEEEAWQRAIAEARERFATTEQTAHERPARRAASQSEPVARRGDAPGRPNTADPRSARPNPADPRSARPNPADPRSGRPNPADPRSARPSDAIGSSDAIGGSIDRPRVHRPAGSSDPAGSGEAYFRALQSDASLQDLSVDFCPDNSIDEDLTHEDFSGNDPQVLTVKVRKGPPVPARGAPARPRRDTKPMWNLTARPARSPGPARPAPRATRTARPAPPPTRPPTRPPAPARLAGSSAPPPQRQTSRYGSPTRPMDPRPRAASAAPNASAPPDDVGPALVRAPSPRAKRVVSRRSEREALAKIIALAKPRPPRA